MTTRFPSSSADSDIKNFFDTISHNITKLEYRFSNYCVKAIFVDTRPALLCPRTRETQTIERGRESSMEDKMIFEAFNWRNGNCSLNKGKGGVREHYDKRKRIDRKIPDFLCHNI